MSAISRRCRTYSLRTLFMLVTMCALGSAIVPPLAKRYHEWKRQRDFDHLIHLIVTTVKFTSGPWDDYEEPLPSEP
jgi:hypothetical protein